MGYIYDNASSLVGKQGSDEVGIKTRVNQTNIDAVRFGLRGFKNFVDRTGNQVPFKNQKAVVNSREYDVVHDIMNMLGVQLIAELPARSRRSARSRRLRKKTPSGRSRHQADAGAQLRDVQETGGVGL